MPDIILSTRQEDDRRQTEEIGGLITIGKRPESALVVPERKCGMRGVECEAKCSEKNDAGSEPPKLLAHFPQFQIKRADVVEPTQASQETDKTSKGNPRLRRKCAGEADAEIVLQGKTPCRLEKPAGRQECGCGQGDSGQQNQVETPPK